MSWSRLVAILRREAGDETGRHLAAVLVDEMRGQRITIGAREPLRAEDVAQHPGTPREVAEHFGVHRTTIYRLIR